MKRGEIWTLAGGGDFVGKPRPVVVLQDDRFEALESVTVCPLTTASRTAPLFRLVVDPTPMNGLDAPSSCMADKLTTVRKTRLREQVGVLEPETMRALGEAVLTFLGFAQPGGNGFSEPN